MIFPAGVTGGTGGIGILVALGIAIAIIAIIIAFLYFIFAPVRLMFTDHNIAQWKAFIPFYNIHQLLKIKNLDFVFGSGYQYTLQAL